MKHAQLTLRCCAQNMLLEILKDVERDGHQVGAAVISWPVDRSVERPEAVDGAPCGCFSGPTGAESDARKLGLVGGVRDGV